MAKISKPDANPIVAMLLTWFVFGIGHWVINGQQKKWLYTLVVSILTSCICVGFVVAILSIIDAYKTAEKLQAGKEIDENEYSVELLYKIMKIVHKEAIFVP